MNTDQKESVKRPGRKRTMLGWTLLAVGLLVAGVWVASGWGNISYAPGRWLVRIGGGVFHINYNAPSHNPEVLGWKHSWRSTPAWLWWGKAIPRNAWTDVMDLRVVQYVADPPPDPYRIGYLLVHFWPLPLFLWPPAALLLRSGFVARQRALTGKCRSCGYDLAGLGDGAVCPECGKGEKASAAPPAA